MKMTQTIKKPDQEQVSEMRESLSSARIHAFGDMSQSKGLTDLEGHFRQLIDPNTEKRMAAAESLGKMLSDPKFAQSRHIESSATHILSACVKDPDPKVRNLTAKQLKSIVAVSPVTSMRHVISLNALRQAPKWGKIFGKWI